MATPTPEEVTAIATELSKRLTDEGKLIEGGWVSFRMVITPKAGDVQLQEMRTAFFAGAHHLFASIMTILDAGDEATPRDLARLSAIHEELERFRAELELRAARTKGSA